MKLTVRGFRKVTLKKFDKVKESPLIALSSKNQEALGIKAGEIEVNDASARLVDGSSDKFVGMTKTLRDNLGVESGQVASITFEDNVLKIDSK